MASGYNAICSRWYVAELDEDFANSNLNFLSEMCLCRWQSEGGLLSFLVNIKPTNTILFGEGYWLIPNPPITFHIWLYVLPETAVCVVSFFQAADIHFLSHLLLSISPEFVSEKSFLIKRSCSSTLRNYQPSCHSWW